MSNINYQALMAKCIEPYSKLVLHTPGTGKSCYTVGAIDAFKAMIFNSYYQGYIKIINKLRKRIMATRIQRCWRKYWYTDLDEGGVNRFCKYSMKEMYKNDNK